MEINWAEIIREILGHGLSQTEVADACGLKPPSIIDLLTGRQKTVKWEVGDKLLALRKKLSRDAAKAA